jgi:hypothetical protein
MCTSATTDDPELLMLAVPRPTVVRGICCWVATRLKSQFRRSKLIGIGERAAAVPAPSVKAEVKAEVTAEAVKTVIAVADIPKRLSPGICPTISLR